MTALDLLKVPPRGSGPLTFAPVEVDVAYDPDAQLEKAAAAVKFQAIAEALVGGGPSAMVADLLAVQEAAGATALNEGAYWDPEKHPRWPKGTPLAGKFMKVGQRFELNGVQYDVSAVLPGKVQAHVVTGGHVTGAKTVTLDAHTLKDEVSHENPHGVVLKGATRPQAEPITAATAHEIKSTGKGGTATVVDAHVDHASHDSSIAIPSAAQGHITPAAWTRFGKLDQERYSQLMERYGTWSPGKAKTLIAEAKKKADPSIWSIVSSGYKSQYGSSSGLSLSMHQVFSNVLGAIKGGDPAEKARTEFEESRALQHELASAIQWDLFNRAQSPDVSVFHMSPEGRASSTWSGVLKGTKPIFSGLSTSQHYGANFNFGDNVLAMPLAIRHVVLATISGDVVSHSFASEKEIATADPLVVDPKRTTMWSSKEITPAQSNWLSSQTKGAASGEVIEKLLANINGGEPLPIPPASASISMDNASGKSWTEPPAAAVKQGQALTDKKWAKTSSKLKGEGPWPLPANELRLAPGDFIQGNPQSNTEGTLYVIVPDPTDEYMGLAYYKLTEPNGKTPATTGQAFHFEGGGTTKFKKIDAHFDWEAYEASQAKTSGTKAFHPEAWTETSDQKFVGDLAPGTKFKVHGKVWEVVDKTNAAQSKIKLVESGEGGTINNDYKTPWLQLQAGMTEDGVPQFDPSQFFQGKSGQLRDLGLQVGDTVQVSTKDSPVFEITGSGDGAFSGKLLTGKDAGKELAMPDVAVGSKFTAKPLGWTDPVPGDTLAIDGKKATVTKLLKDGTVQINTHPGVLKVQPDDPVLAGLYAPEKHDLGDKVKLKDLAPGQKFHGGTGNKVRPYVVLAQEGKTTKVQNLDTGEQLSISAAKSFPKLHLKQDAAVAAPEEPHVTPHDPGATFDSNAFENGPDVAMGKLSVGDKFVMNGVPYSLVHLDGKGEVTNLLTGESIPVASSAAALTAGLDKKHVTTLVPKVATVEPQQLHHLAYGEHFISGGVVYKNLGTDPEMPLIMKGLSSAGVEKKFDALTLVVKVPAPASSLEPEAATHEGTFGDVAVGGKFTAHDAVWEKTGPTSAAIMEVLDKHQGAPVGFTEDQFTDMDSVDVHFSAEYVKTFGMPGDMTANEGPDAQTFEQLGLGVGDKVKLIHGVATVTKVYGEPGTQGHVYDTVDDATGETSTFGVQGKPSAWAKVSTAEPDAPAEANAPDPAGMQLPATAYDPAAYVKGDGVKTLKELQVGDIFVGAKNGKHYLVTKTGAASGLTALDLQTGKSSAPWKYDKKAEVMHPKWGSGDVTPEAGDEHLPGDGVQLGWLKVGDHFTAQWGDTKQVYEVTKPAPKGEAGTVTIAPVAPDFTLGPETSLNTSPLTPVTFHQHAEGVSTAKSQLAAALAADKIEPPVETIDAGMLDYADDHGLTPFSPKSKTGGGYFFTKAKFAGEGTLFQSKDGSVWKVKQAGPTPIVTDGAGLFKVDGDHNFKIVDVPFDDKSLPLHVTSGEVQAAVTEAAHDDAPDGSTIGGLGLGKGDTFTSSVVGAKGTWSVLEVQPNGWVTVSKVGGTKTKQLPPSHTVDSHTSAAGVEVGKPVKASQLGVGDHFEAQGGSVYKVVEKNGGTQTPGAELTLLSVAGTDKGTTYPSSFWSDAQVGSGWTKVDAPAGSAAVVTHPPINPDDYVMGTEKQAQHLKTGDLFMDNEGFYWRVTEPMHDGIIMAQDAQTLGEPIDFDSHEYVTPMNPIAGATTGAPETPPSFDQFTENKYASDELPIGSFGWNGDADGAIFKKVGTAENGGAQMQVVVPSGMAGALPAGELVDFPLGQSLPMVHVPDDAKPPSDAQPLDTFTPGTWVDVNGEHYQITSVKSWSGEGDAQFVTGKKEDGSLQSLPVSLTGKPMETPPEPTDEPAGPRVPDAESFEPNGDQYVGEVAVGVHVKGVGGTVFKVVSHDEDGGKTTIEPVADLQQGDTFSGSGTLEVGKPITVSAMWLPNEIEGEKAAAPQVDVAHLGVGSEFESSWGDKYEVAGHEFTDGTMFAVPIGMNPDDEDQHEGFDYGTMVTPISVSAHSTPVRALKVGDFFADNTTGGTYKVTEILPSGNGIVGEDVESGAEEPFGMAELVKPLPHMVGAPAADEYVELGKTSLGNLAPGDVFKSPTSGVKFKVVKHGATLTTVKPLSEPDGPGIEAAQVTPVVALKPASDMNPLFDPPAPDGMQPNELTAAELPVGAEVSGNGPGIVWKKLEPPSPDGPFYAEVTAHPVPDMVGTMVEFVPSYVPSHAVPTPLEVPGAEALTVELPANPGKPIGALAVGDAVQTPHGSIFEVTGKPPSGIISVKLLHGVDGDPVAGTNDFGPTWMPAGVQPGGWSPPETASPIGPGEALKSALELDPGMHYSTGTGNVYKVLDVGHVDGVVYVHSKLVQIGDPNPGEGLTVGAEFNDVVGAGYVPPWTVFDPDDLAPDAGTHHAPPAKAAPAKTGDANKHQPGAGDGGWDDPLTNDLKPFSPKSQTGGGYFFGKLGAIPEGTVFTDKSGGQFTKIGMQGAHAVYKDESGSAFIGPSDAKVKLLKRPPDTQGAQVSGLQQALAGTPNGKVSELEDSAANFFTAPYDSEGKVVAVGLLHVKPGQHFETADGGKYELIAHAGGEAIVRVTSLAGVNDFYVKMAHIGHYVRPLP